PSKAGPLAHSASPSRADLNGMADMRSSSRILRLAPTALLVVMILFAGVGPAAGMTRKSDSSAPGKPTNVVAVPQVTSAQPSWATGSGWVDSFSVYLNGGRVATLSAR